MRLVCLLCGRVVVGVFCVCVMRLGCWWVCVVIFWCGLMRWCVRRCVGFMVLCCRVGIGLVGDFV